MKHAAIGLMHAPTYGAQEFELRIARQLGGITGLPNRPLESIVAGSYEVREAEGGLRLRLASELAGWKLDVVVSCSGDG